MQTESTIGGLRRATYLARDSLFIAEQQGSALAVDGGLLIDFAQDAARDAVAPQVSQADAFAQLAETAKSGAQAAANAVANMSVDAVTTESGTQAQVSKVVENGALKLTFSIPKGDSGVVAPANGFFTMSVDENGNLYAMTSGDAGAPVFEYDATTGDLYFITEGE